MPLHFLFVVLFLLSYVAGNEQISPELQRLDFLRLGNRPSTASEPCPLTVQLAPLPERLPLEFSVTLEAIHELIQFEMKKTNTTALALGITYGDRVVYKKTFCNGCRKPVTENTLFRVGSLSKVWTVLMLMKLRDMGKVSLDDPITKYWPEFALNNSYSNSRGITFWDIAGQVSGLPTGTPCHYLNNGCNVSTQEILKRLKSFTQVFPNSWFPHYSDLGYALLGRLLERPAGMTWENFLSQHLLAPLGLRSTNWVFNEEARSLLAEPLLSNLTVLDSIAWADMLWARPTGGMYMSINDLLVFTKMFIDANEEDEVFPSNTTYPVSFSSLREMLAPRHVNTDGSSGFASPLELYFTKATDNWVKGKGGFWPGYSAEFLVIPELKFGVSILSNNVAGVVAGRSVVKLYGETLKNYLKKVPHPIQPPKDIEKYAGRYFPQDISPLIPGRLFLDITVSQDKTTLETSSGYFVWSGKGHVFISQLYANTSCINKEMGSYKEPLDFDVDDNGNVLGCYYPESEPFYNYYWLKQK